MIDSPLPVLMYHGLHVDRQSRGRYDPVYSVTPQEFATQLDWLIANGYHARRLSDVVEGRHDAKRVLISFDDGDVSNVEVALPLLLERGMVAEFFVTSDFVNQAGMLSSADVRRLVDAGMGVQSHGCSHAFFADLSPDALELELRNSKSRLEHDTGQSVDALALPGGRGGERERLAALATGYRYVLNSQPGTNQRWRSGDYLQRLSVQRGLAIEDFAALVEWRGFKPRLAALRYHALALPKNWLGNKRYEHWRARVLGQ